MAQANRICGSVSAGVRIFSPSRLFGQEPRGDQRQSLVMMPTLPVADLIVRQAGLAFASLETVFDTVLGFGNAREFGQLRIRVCVRQIIVGQRFSTLIAAADDHQDFGRLSATTIRLGNHRNGDDLDGQRPLFTVAHVHRAVPALLALVERQGAELSLLATHHATLDDVFVALTGRQLRND